MTYYKTKRFLCFVVLLFLTTFVSSEAYALSADARNAVGNTLERLGVGTITPGQAVEDIQIVTGGTLSTDQIENIVGPVLDAARSGNIDLSQASTVISDGLTAVIPEIVGGELAGPIQDIITQGIEGFANGNLTNVAFSQATDFLQDNVDVVTGLLPPEVQGLAQDAIQGLLNGNIPDIPSFETILDTATAYGIELGQDLLAQGGDQILQLGEQLLQGTINADALSSILDVRDQLAGITDPAQIANIVQNIPGVSDLLDTYSLLDPDGQLTAAANLISQALGPDIAQALSADQISSIISNTFPSLGIDATAVSDFLTDSGIASSLANAGIIDPSILSSAGVTGSAGSAVGGASCCSAPFAITSNHFDIQAHVTSEFETHQNFLVNTYFFDNILPAMQRMTLQLTTVGIQQVEIIGTFLDAKHQLETQRLFQQLQAKAHKDYHPSTGMCTIGTNMRGLSMSERNSELSALSLSSRLMSRQLLSVDGLSREGTDSDFHSRIQQYVTVFCDQADNANGLGNLCEGNTSAADRKNRDIDYTETIEAPLTLSVDFNVGGDPSPDEENVFALASNLYANEVLPYIEDTDLVAVGGGPSAQAFHYLDLRSVAAKRSVAHNSFASIAALKAEGSGEVAPFLQKIAQDLGVPDTEITALLGARPSYFAQMEVLTKKMFQNPVFYTDLYDKPTNIARRGAALQAIGLMQDRDIYRSLLRSEAALSVLLELKLAEEQRDIEIPDN